jgi:hypothetical protein
LTFVITIALALEDAPTAGLRTVDGNDVDHFQ